MSGSGEILEWKDKTLKIGESQELEKTAVNLVAYRGATDDAHLREQGLLSARLSIERDRGSYLKISEKIIHDILRKGSLERSSLLSAQVLATLVTACLKTIRSDVQAMLETNIAPISENPLIDEEPDWLNISTTDLIHKTIENGVDWQHTPPGYY